MKKLLILAAVACAAISSQAIQTAIATTASNIYDGGGNQASLYSGTAYVFKHTEGPQLMLNLIQDALEGSNPSTASSVAADYAIATVSIDSGNISASPTMDSNTLYYYFFVALSEDYSSMFYSGMQKMTRKGGSYSLAFGDLSASSKTSQACPNLFSYDDNISAGWYSVPEPTSGLLMLLGLAGIALKRKRG